MRCLRGTICLNASTTALVFKSRTASAAGISGGLKFKCRILSDCVGFGFLLYQRRVRLCRLSDGLIYEGFHFHLGSETFGDAAGLGNTKDRLRGAETEGCVFRLEHGGDRLKRLFGQVLHEVVEIDLVAGSALMQYKAEIRMFVPPFVDGGAVDTVLPRDGGHGLAGQEPGDDLRLDASELGHKFLLDHEDRMAPQGLGQFSMVKLLTG
jgi:hypothetical protein